MVPRMATPLRSAEVLQSQRADSMVSWLDRFPFKRDQTHKTRWDAPAGGAQATVFFRAFASWFKLGNGRFFPAATCLAPCVLVDRIC